MEKSRKKAGVAADREGGDTAGDENGQGSEGDGAQATWASGHGGHLDGVLNAARSTSEI